MKNKGKAYFLIPYYLWIALFVIAPVLLVVYYSLFDLDGHLTLDNYVNFFTPVYMKMMLNSFWYAFLITLFSLLVAYPAAYLLTRTKHKQLWLLLIILPTWINLLLKTYAFIGIFGTFWPGNHLFGLLGLGEQQLLCPGFSFVVVSVCISCPFWSRPILSALGELSLSLVGGARDLGAEGWRTFRRVIFPLTISGVRSGCMAVFIPALSLFMITRLIAGNRVITLGTAIEQHFLVTQDWGMGSTVAVFLIVIMALFMLLTGSSRRGVRQ
ncbi:spermidine/putrescine ABC transporter permease [Paenibacillus riograndensis]|nr:spermidine/putrescine ABC transporter permease [Paenibacillus riograndensis]